MKKEFDLNGLECAKCLSQISQAAKKLVNVKVNIESNGLLIIEAEHRNAIDSAIHLFNGLLKGDHHNYTLIEKKEIGVVKKEYPIRQLGCASCASKIEDAVNKLPNVRKAVVNFATQKIIIEMATQEDLEAILPKVGKIVEEIEPDACLITETQASFKLTRNKNISSHKVEVHDSCCRDEHSHNEMVEVEEEHDHQYHVAVSMVKPIVELVITILLMGAGIFLIQSALLKVIIFVIAYLIIGGDIVLYAFKNILKGKVFDENFLMSIATIGAFAIQEYHEAVAVMIFYKVGELFQDLAVNRSRKSIASLMDIRPDYANLKLGETITKVEPNIVHVGDLIVVKPGEKVPLDGIVMEGTSYLDTKALTGESELREVGVGDVILSGTINKNGLLLIKVEKIFSESTVSKILELVENAGNRKAHTETFISKFAKIYTPIVVILALVVAVLPPLLIPNQVFRDWLYRALIFLVISCPCALVVSIPLGYFGGIGGASRLGILIKGGNYLEALTQIKTVVFDKTGTLTKGEFAVEEIMTEEGYQKEDILKYAAYAESYSLHPIAVSIQKKYQEDSKESKINQEEITSYEEIAGYGIKAEVAGKQVLVGNGKLLTLNQITFQETAMVGTIIYVAIDSKFAGYLVVLDAIKKDAYQLAEKLKHVGVENIVMLTGDNEKVAMKVANELQITEVHANLLPQHKVELFEEMKKKTTSGIAFVGDGMNDAPVLALADVGIAMGGVGSDAAIEAADAIIMNDEPSKIITAIQVAKRTRRIVIQNIIFALVVKLLFLVLGLLNIAQMWYAVIADVGVTLLAVFNSMRVLNIKKYQK